MAFTAKDVQALREKTGCGMMDCKKALVDSNGDIEQAIEALRKKGLAAAEKKASRIAAEGIVFALVQDNAGAIIEVNSETDFVAKNEGFQAFVRLVAETVIKENPVDLEALLACKVDGETIEAKLQEKILTIGENIKIRRFERFAGALCAYNHGGGTHAVIVQFEADDAVVGNPAFEAYAKDIAMQIAALNPTYLSKEDVPAAEAEHEKSIMIQRAIEGGKPENIAEKMALSGLNTYYKEVCLTEQAFAKDSKISVGQYTQNTAKALGGAIKIVTYRRYETGEGLEKRQDDFAAEIASMQKI